jgi:hypothetical protein
MLAFCGLEFSAQEFDREIWGKKRSSDRARGCGRHSGDAASLTGTERGGNPVGRGEES